MSGSLVGVDPSIPLRAGQGVQQPNPLQQIGQFANAANSLNQLKLFPGQQQLQQQAVQGGAVSLSQHINQAGYQALAPLLAPGVTITHDNLTTALASIEHNMGIPTSGILQDVLSTAPSGDTPEFSNKVRSLIASRAMTSPESSVGAVTPQPGPQIVNGQQILPTTTAPAGSATPGVSTPTGQSFPVYPSTGQLMGQVTWTDQNGATHYGTQAEYAQARGIPGAVLSPAMPAQQGAAPLAGGLAPVSGTAGPATPQSPPRLTDTQGALPGTPEYLAGQAAPAQAIADRVSHFQSDMFPLQQAQTALAKAPTGKGSDAAHDVSSYLNTFGSPMLQKALSFISPIMTPDEVSAYDEAKKYLTQGQLGQTGASRSDQGLTTAGAASPSTTISKEAAQLVLKGMIGLRRMEQDEGQTWLASGIPPQQLNQFRAQFQKNLDPRVYTFDQITPQQRQDILQSFKTPAARQQFIAGVERAENNGVMSAPGINPGAQ